MWNEKFFDTPYSNSSEGIYSRQESRQTDRQTDRSRGLIYSYIPQVLKRNHQHGDVDDHLRC